MNAGERAHRLILRGGRSAAIGLLIRFGARILFLYVAARLFGAVLFGAYSLAVALVELGVVIGGLGMKRLLFKLLDEDESGRAPAHIVLDAAFVVAAVSLALSALVAGLVALPPVHDLLGETAWPLLILAPMIAGQALLDLFLAATRWKHRMRYEVVGRSIVEPYAGVAATLAAYFAGFSETGLLIGYWAGTLAALVYAVAGTRSAFGSLSLRSYRLAPGRVRAILREGAMPMAGDLAGGFFTRLDLYLVGIMLGEGPAGIYGVARQVRTPIRQVRQSFDGLLTPIVARTLAARGAPETGLALASAARLILAIQLPILIALAAIGVPLLTWFGPEFAAGYWAMLLLGTAEAVQGAFGIGDLILLYRRPALVVKVVSAAIAVNLALGWLLIREMGLDGAALAVLAAIVTSAIVRRILLRTRFEVRVPLHHSAAPIAAAAVAAAGVHAATRLTGAAPWGAPLALVAGLVAYGVVLKLWLAIAGDNLALRHFEAVDSTRGSSE